MKKLALLAFSAIALLLTTTSNVRGAWVNTNALLLQLQITGVMQTNFNGKTVTNAAGIATTTITAKPITITTKDLLRMLESEFNTNFPTGAQLAFGVAGPISGFMVTDSSGNPILDVSSNPNNSSYVFAISNAVVGGNFQLQYGKLVQNFATTNATGLITQIFRYYGFFYKDSHGNDFSFVGNLTAKISVLESPSLSLYRTFTINFPGSGGGVITREGVPGYAAFSRALLVGGGKNIVP